MQWAAIGGFKWEQVLSGLLFLNVWYPPLNPASDAREIEAGVDDEGFIYMAFSPRGPRLCRVSVVQGLQAHRTQRVKVKEEANK